MIVEVRRDNAADSDENEIRAIMDACGLQPRGYDPFSRQLPDETERPQSKNVIFVRDEPFFATTRSISRQYSRRIALTGLLPRVETRFPLQAQ